MAAIPDLNELINVLTGGAGAREQIFVYTDNRQGAAAGAAAVAGQFTSLWNFNSMPGGQGAAAGGTARICTRATQGALGQSNPTGGRSKYLAGVHLDGNVALTGLVYDRLCDMSGFSGTVTTAQNTTGLACDRYTGADSVGNQLWIEINTIIGATATTLTCSYTNQAGTSGQVTKPVVFGGTARREATRGIWLPLADGDTGVRSVESVTVLATTGTAGDFGVVIVRPIVNVTVGSAGIGSTVDCLTQLPSFPVIQTDACIAQIVYASTTTSPSTWGTFSFVEY